MTVRSLVFPHNNGGRPRRVVGDRTVHVSVLVAFDAWFRGLSKQPVTLPEVIESESIDTGMVTINAEAMSKGIDATGHIAIYGVYFDTNADGRKKNRRVELVKQ